MDKSSPTESLHTAIAKHDSNHFRRLLSQATANQPDDKGRTPLHFAIEMRELDFIPILLNQGADIEALDADHRTPLHLAMVQGLFACSQQLLDLGASLFAQDNLGLTPLHLAAQKGHKAILSQTLIRLSSADKERLWQTADKAGCTLLHASAEQKQADLIHLLMLNGAHVNALSVKGLTPLHIAVQNKQLAVVKALIAWGANGQLPNSTGQSPLSLAESLGEPTLEIAKCLQASIDEPVLAPFTSLHDAIKNQRLDTFEFLLEVGADRYERDKRGRTPLHLIVLNQEADMLTSFIAQGVDVHRVDTAQHRTPLHLAMTHANPAIVAPLLAVGAKLTTPDIAGETPLHVAARYGHIDLLECLFAQVEKATLNHWLTLRDEDGRTLLHHAACQSNPRVVRRLLQYGAKVNAQNNYLYTPLHFAAKHGYLDIANALLDNEADVHARTREGYTPYRLACHFQQAALKQRLAPFNALLQRRTNLQHSHLQTTNPLNPYADTLALTEALHSLTLGEDPFYHLVNQCRHALHAHGLDKLAKQLNKLQPPASTIKTALPPNLKATNALFQPIQNFIQSLTLLLSQSEPVDVQTSVQALISYYQQFILDVCSAPLNYHPESPTRLHSAELGSHVLKPEAAQHLFQFYEAGGLKRETKYGTRVVRPYNHIHFKFSPSAPGIEYAVDRLNKLVLDEGSAPTVLLKLEHQVKSYLVQASKTIEGDNFQTLFNDNPSLINHIAHDNFSRLFILSLLTQPEDAKPDNFIALKAQTNPPVLRLVGIDNDMAFYPPWLEQKHPQGTRYWLQMKNILFCLPHMHLPLHPSCQEQLLALNPGGIVIQWLSQLAEQNKAYDALQTAGLLTKHDLSDLHLPLQLPKGTATRIYQQLEQLQQMLKENPEVTHWSLFEQLYPIVAYYYQYLLSQSETEQDAIALVYSGKSPTLNEIIPTNWRLPDGRLAHAVLAEPLSDETQQPLAMLEEFIATLDWSVLPPEQQRSLWGRLIADGQALEHLTLTHCHFLTPHDFEQLPHHFPHLQRLSFQDCQINYKSLSALITKRPQLPIIVGETEAAALTVDGVLALAKHSQGLGLRVDKQVITLHTAAPYNLYTRRGRATPTISACLEAWLVKHYPESRMLINPTQSLIASATTEQAPPASTTSRFLQRQSQTLQQRTSSANVAMANTTEAVTFEKQKEESHEIELLRLSDNDRRRLESSEELSYSQRL